MLQLITTRECSRENIHLFRQLLQGYAWEEMDLTYEPGKLPNTEINKEKRKYYSYYWLLMLLINQSIGLSVCLSICLSVGLLIHNFTHSLIMSHPFYYRTPNGIVEPLRNVLFGAGDCRRKGMVWSPAGHDDHGTVQQQQQQHQ